MHIVWDLAHRQYLCCTPASQAHCILVAHDCCAASLESDLAVPAAKDVSDSSGSGEEEEDGEGGSGSESEGSEGGSGEGEEEEDASSESSYDSADDPLTDEEVRLGWMGGCLDGWLGAGRLRLLSELQPHAPTSAWATRVAAMALV